METGNKKVNLALTSQLLLRPNIVKSTVTSENFQISLGDGVPKNSFAPSEVMNELARVHLTAMEWEIIREGKLYELKIKVPRLCSGKIKEIGLYYSEGSQDNRTLIAYSYQAQARQEGEGEELALQLVLPYNEESETENTNNVENSVPTQGTAGLGRTMQATAAPPKECIVRDKNDICLISPPKKMGAHNNRYGTYDIKVIDTNEERTVVSVSYYNWPPKKFIIAKGYNLVPNDSSWHYWKVEKDYHSETQEQINELIEKSKDEKDQTITEVQNQLDENLKQKIKELQDIIDKITADPKADQRDRKIEINQDATKEIAKLNEEIAKLRERLNKLGGGTEGLDLEKKIQKLEDNIKEILRKKEEKIGAINEEKDGDRIKALNKELDELKEKLTNENNQKLKELEGKINAENDQKIKDLEEKLTKEIKEKQKEDDKNAKDGKEEEAESHIFCNCAFFIASSCCGC